MRAGVVKDIARIVALVIISISVVHFPAHAQSGTSNINVRGALFDSSGNFITSPSVNFKIELYDKTGLCLLYTEDHLGLDLSQTKGSFSIDVGDGTSIQNLIDTTAPNAMTSKVYENVGPITGGWTGCPSGATLADGDARVIRIKYNLGGGYVTMHPDVPMDSAAYATVAQTLQGKRPSDFIQVHNDVTNKVTQANVENIFSSTNYPKLTALLGGSSTDYISANPSAAVGFNNQRLTNVANPTAAQDAATKNYADSFVGGKAADVSGVGPATGDGYALIWDQTAQKWKAGPATDPTKLPLAGGTMSGAITMGGNDLFATGHITMSPLKTLTLGTFNNAQESALVATLTAANAGASWYNSQSKLFKIWDGSAVTSQSINGIAAGGDLTGTYPNPTIANDKVTSAKVDSAGMAINRLVISDQTTGSSLKFASCGTNEVLRYEGANGWICRDPSAIVTFPVTKVNGKTGDITLNPADLGLGTAALENVGTSPGNIPQLDGGGKIPAALLPALGGNYIVDGGNTTGAAISVGTNDNFALNFRTSGTNKMTIDNAGKVGIGTTAPSTLLSLGGTPNSINNGLSMGSGDFTLYQPASGQVVFRFGGVDRWYMQGGSLFTDTGTGPGFFPLNTAIVRPRYNEDTGLGHVAADSVSLVTAGSHRLTVDASGNVGVGTTAPARLLHVNGPMRVTPAALPLSPAAGDLAFDSNASNALKFYDGSAWQTVGTGSGSGDFMKNGSVAMTGDFNAGGHNLTNLGTNISGPGALLMSSGADITFAPTGNTIFSSGKVGIGTTSPVAKLDIVAPANTDMLRVSGPAGITTFDQYGSILTNSGINISNWDSNVSSGAVTTWGKDLYLTTDGSNGGGSNHNIVLMPQGSGKVGIGTTAPARLLHVNGPMRVTPAALPSSPAAGDLAFDSNAANALKFYDGSAWQTVGTGTGSGDFLRNGSLAMTGNFNAGGNKILGNTTPSANLTLESTSDVSKGNVVIQPNGGNVGIGTATPDALLNLNASSGGQAPNIGSLLHMTGATNSSIALTMDAYGSNFHDSPYLTMRKAHGTSAAPTATLVNDILGEVQTFGWNGTGWGSGGAIEISAVENWSGTASGTKTLFTNIKPGTNTYSSSMTLSGNGIAAAGNFIAANALDVNGGAVIGNSYVGVRTAPSNGLLVQGNVGIGTTTPTRLLDVAGPVHIAPAALPLSPTAGDLAFDSNASNALSFYDGAAWKTVSTGGGSSALSGITQATATNTIDNTNFGQTWNWSTASTQNPLTINANALTTGSILTLSTSNTSVNSTSGLLNVANTGTSTNGVLARFQSNSTAGSGMTILNNGAVGIGATTPKTTLHVFGTHNDSNDVDGAGNVSATYSRELATPTAASSAWYSGVWGYSVANTTNSMSRVIGVRGDSDTNANATVTNSVGVQGLAVTSNAGATLANAYGGYFSTTNLAGTITKGYGVYTGNIAGTTKYSFYASDSTAPSYFAGNVGIGTTNPVTNLHIVNGGVSGQSFTSSTGLLIENNGVTNAYNAFQIATAGAGKAFTVSNAGNVGIGSWFSTPDSNMKLSIGGSSGFPANSGTTQTGAIRIGNSTGAASLYSGVDNTSGTSWLQGASASNLATNYSLVLNPNGGNVGIGTATPTQALEIAGNLRANHLVGGTSTPSIAAGTGAGTGPTVSVTGSDMSGLISVTTGTTPATASTLVTLTFNSPYSASPNCVTSPNNAFAAAISGLSNVYVTTTTTALVINTGSTALASSVTYKWMYVCGQ